MADFEVVFAVAIFQSGKITRQTLLHPPVHVEGQRSHEATQPQLARGSQQDFSGLTRHHSSMRQTARRWGGACGQSRDGYGDLVSSVRQLSNGGMERVSRGPEQVGRTLYAALVDEVDRRQATGQLSPLRAAQVLHAAIAAASGGRGRPDARPSVPVHVFVAELISGSARPHPVDATLPPLDPALPEPRRGPEKRRKAAKRARAREEAWAKEQKQAAQRERERRQEQEAEFQRWRAETAHQAAQRQRAEQEAPGLLAGAGVAADKNTLEIATLLLIRHEEVTPERLRRAVRAFEETYEARVRSFRESGGLMPWPRAETLIPVLFGPRPRTPDD